jgi:hypothetical protein
VRNYSYPYDDGQPVDESLQYDSDDINAESRTFNSGLGLAVMLPNWNSSWTGGTRKAQRRNTDRWVHLRKSHFSIKSRASQKFLQQ